MKIFHVPQIYKTIKRICSMAANPLFDTNLMILQVFLVVAVIFYYKYRSWEIEKKNKRK